MVVFAFSRHLKMVKMVVFAFSRLRKMVKMVVLVLSRHRKTVKMVVFAFSRLRKTVKMVVFAVFHHSAGVARPVFTSPRFRRLPQAEGVRFLYGSTSCSYSHSLLPPFSPPLRGRSGVGLSPPLREGQGGGSSIPSSRRSRALRLAEFYWPEAGMSCFAVRPRASRASRISSFQYPFSLLCPPFT